jgi:hypothetical protein
MDFTKPCFVGPDVQMKPRASFSNEISDDETPSTKPAASVPEKGITGVIPETSDPRPGAAFANEILGAIAAELKLNRMKDHNRIYAEASRRHPALFRGMRFQEVKIRGKK